jgi:hypothetical protein
MLVFLHVMQHRWLVQASPGMPALPKMVLDRYENQPKFCSFNILPEIGRCWASIDNCLFLWRLGEKCAQFRLPRPNCRPSASAVSFALCASPLYLGRLCGGEALLTDFYRERQENRHTSRKQNFVYMRRLKKHGFPYSDHYSAPC